MEDAGLPPPVVVESADGSEDGSSSSVVQEDADIKFQPPVKMEPGEDEYILPDVSLIIALCDILFIIVRWHARVSCNQLLSYLSLINWNTIPVCF